MLVSIHCALYCSKAKYVVSIGERKAIINFQIAECKKVPLIHILDDLNSSGAYTCDGQNIASTARTR